MKNKNIIIYVIICLIIIAGIAVWEAKGFRTEMQFTPRKEIELTNYTGIEISDVEAIASEVLGNTKFMVQRVETFGNAVVIVAKDITEEQRNNIVTKFNEKYGTELKSENIEIVSIPFTRIKDVIKRFIVPGIVSLILVLAYFVLRYKKIGWKKVTIKTLLTPVVAELLLFSIISIIRVPFSRLAVSLGVGTYISIIILLTILFAQQENEQQIAELELKIRNAKVINENEIDLETVQIGNVVKVRDLEFDEDITYTIVGSTEVNLAENKISNESPLGKALLGQKKGKIIEVNAPAGVIKYKILSLKK